MLKIKNNKELKKLKKYFEENFLQNPPKTKDIIIEDKPLIFSKEKYITSARHGVTRVIPIYYGCKYTDKE